MGRQELRGWATVWRVEAADGVWFAKQNCPGQRVEVALMATLAEVVPERVVPVTAARDGFLLTPDQGEVFYETAGGDLANWVRLAREAAELQRALLPHHDASWSRGTELRPEQAADYLSARIEQYAALAPGTAAGSTRTSPNGCARTGPSYDGGPTGRGARPAAHPQPQRPAREQRVRRGGPLRFFDFGDALVTEPLGVLLIRLTSGGEARGRRGRPAPVAGRRCGPGVWSDLVPMTELRAALPAALQLGRLGWVESWGPAAKPSLSDESSRSGGR